MAIVMVKLKHRRSTTSSINLRRRCIKKGFDGIHDRFQKDFGFRDSQLRIDRTEADFIYRLSSEEYERYKRTWFISQHIWTKCTDETPIRLQRSINHDAPSSPLVWRCPTCTDSFLAVSEMAFVVLFIQHIMVAVERSLVEVIIH